MSAGAPRQVGVVAVVGYPVLYVLPLMMFARIALGWWPVLRAEQVELLWPTLILYPCVKQYPTLSHAGLVLLQWEGQTRASVTGVGDDVV